MHQSAVALALCLSLVLGASGPLARAGAPVAPPLRPIVMELAPSPIPVYLPSWLPGFLGKYYPAAQVTPNGYNAYLLLKPGLIAHFNWAWTLFAQRGTLSRHIGPGSRQVSLGTLGGMAYLDLNHHTNYGPTITWYLGGATYTLFASSDPRNPSEEQTVDVTLRIARSFVRVH